jgi:hypothetical protein
VSRACASTSPWFHNYFFEGNISVAGLIVGRDIVRVLSDFPVHDTVICPR